jgi:hypothetical protein
METGNVVREEIYDLQNIFIAVQDAVCSAGLIADVDRIGELMGSDRRCYQFYSIKETNHPEGTDLRTVYCSEKKRSSNKTSNLESLGCGNPECSGVGKRRCSKCTKVAYCSQECQKTMWPSHASVCRKTFSTIEFWRWFSTGKCSLIHFALIESINRLLDRDSRTTKSETKNTKGKKTRVRVSYEGKTFCVEKAFLSGPYKYVDPTGSIKLGYVEAVHVYDNRPSNFNSETISLSSFRDEDVDRLNHVAIDSLPFETDGCKDSLGRNCSKNRCVLPFHFGMHQLAILKVVPFDETEILQNEQTLSHLYVDIAGMQYGQDELLILSKKELATYYGRIEELEEYEVYSEEDFGVDASGSRVSQEAKEMTDHITEIAIKNLTKIG